MTRTQTSPEVETTRAPLICLSMLLLTGSTVWAQGWAEAGARPAGDAPSPFNVTDRSQLFVDKLLVRETNGVWFTQHPGQKHDENPLLVPDQPWESWLVAAGSVIFDAQEKTFRMWYTNYHHSTSFQSGSESYFDQSVICYASSGDGIHWEKPLLGTIKARNGKPHNAVIAGVHPASVMKDLLDSDPGRRYKMVGYSRRPKGYQTMVSPDGLNWAYSSEKPIAPEGDVISAYFDRTRGKFVAFPKIHKKVMGFRRRSFSTIISDDFVNWSEPVPSFTNDLRDDVGALARIERIRGLLDEPDDPRLMRSEFYGVGIYQAESCTIAFPWILTINNNARYRNHQGPMETQLAVSRDLIHWERPFRTPAIEFGELDAWDSVNITSTPSEAIRLGDEIWLYYRGGNQVHGVGTAKKTGIVTIPGHGPRKLQGAIGLIKWKLDRFVSVDGPQAGGSLLTIPIRFKGRRLEINGLTKSGGKITVVVLDADGRPLRGWESSDPFSGDEIRHVMTFDGQSDVSSLQGKAISLRFHLTDAQLFSFAFRSESTPN